MFQPLMLLQDGENKNSDGIKICLKSLHSLENM